MNNFWKIKFSLYFLLILLVGQFLFFKPVQAKETYPKLANYQLKFFNQADYDMLKKWDLLIVQPEPAMYNKTFLTNYRSGTDKKVVIYIISSMALNYVLNEPLGLRRYVYDAANINNWWLRNDKGEVCQSWPGTNVVNLANSKWRDFNVDYVVNKLKINDWDGAMYDVVDASVTHYCQRTKVDIDEDGVLDNDAKINKKWQEGVIDLLAKTRQAIGNNKILITNGNSLASYQPNTNGRMFETFPTPWEGNGTWQASMTPYLQQLPGKNKKPNIYIINANTNNTGVMDNYRKMRFGLTSALLGDGYFSFDHGDQAHEQLWWYDEYDVKLGRAESDYFNVLAPTSKAIKPGLWRRDFENGISLVNSGSKEQTYIFDKEEFVKVNGQQDRRVNDGSRVNFVKLAPNDGILLLKSTTELRNTPFANGSFFRVFNASGQQPQAGFFAYKKSFRPNVLLYVGDINNDGVNETVTVADGAVMVYKNGKIITKFYPFGDKFRGWLSLVASDLNHDGKKEFVIAPLSGGGPHVKMFTADGKAISSGFFAIDKNFRGGVNLAVGDLDKDGQDEIITSFGKGMAPLVKIFKQDGTYVRGFSAYAKSFMGGVNTVVADVNNDGWKEIVTGPGLTGGPHLKIFNQSGQILSEFFAFNQKDNKGVKVSASDINGDGLVEVLASENNY